MLNMRKEMEIIGPHHSPTRMKHQSLGEMTQTSEYFL